MQRPWRRIHSPLEEEEKEGKVGVVHHWGAKSDWACPQSAAWQPVLPVEVAK